MLPDFPMTRPAALLLLDTKPNRHSLNALVGALETDPGLDAIELRLPSREAELERDVAEVEAAGKRAVVGLSFTTAQFGRVRELMFRLARPRAEAEAGNSTGRSWPLWIAGGPHPTADPEGTLLLGFDVVVCGEGEATLLDFLQTIAAGDNWTQVPGIACRDPSGRIVRYSAHRPQIDLDAFPPFPLQRRRVVGPIEITRGCPFACGYCQTSHLLGTRPRHRSVETISRYAGVIRQRGLRDVRVVAPDAFAYGSPDGKLLNLEALASLLAALRRVLGREGRLFFGTFPSEVRPEHVNEATLDLVKRYADNDSLIIGGQSGSERMLERCGRQHRVADVFTAVSHAIAAGLKPHVDFIFGLPEETDEERKSTIEVIRELAAMGALIHAHTFMPLPQTRFAGGPPGKVCGDVRLLIKELIRRGALYGIWHKQGQSHNVQHRF